jgi:hypothetical protein
MEAGDSGSAGCECRSVGASDPLQNAAKFYLVCLPKIFGERLAAVVAKLILVQQEPHRFGGDVDCEFDWQGNRVVVFRNGDDFVTHEGADDAVVGQRAKESAVVIVHV